MKVSCTKTMTLCTAIRGPDEAGKARETVLEGMDMEGVEPSGTWMGSLAPDQPMPMLQETGLDVLRPVFE
jgi:hypothetical protein